MWVFAGHDGNVDHYRCKSDTVKPTEGIRDGSDAYEIDSHDVYMFDAEAEAWVKQ